MATTLSMYCLAFALTPPRLLTETLLIAEATPDSSGESAGAAGGALGESVAGEFFPPRETPPSQMAKSLDKTITDMRRMLSRGLDLAREARAERDLIKLNAVNERVIRMKALLRIAERIRDAFNESMRNNDVDDARRQYNKLQVAHSRMQVELMEAMGGRRAAMHGGGIDWGVLGGFTPQFCTALTAVLLNGPPLTLRSALNDLRRLDRRVQTDRRI